MLKDIFTGKFKWKQMDATQHMLVMFVLSCVPLLLLLLPIGGGRSLMDAVGSLAEDNDVMVEGFCFLLTAFLLLFGTWRYRHRKTHSQVEGRDAVAVGLAQMLAASLAGGFPFRFDDRYRHDVRRESGLYGAVFLHSRYPGDPCGEFDGV